MIGYLKGIPTKIQSLIGKRLTHCFLVFVRASNTSMDMEISKDNLTILLNMYALYFILHRSIILSKASRFDDIKVKIFSNLQFYSFSMYGKSVIL